MATNTTTKHIDNIYFTLAALFKNRKFLVHFHKSTERRVKARKNENEFSLDYFQGVRVHR